MDFFQTTENWRSLYPGAAAGILVMENLANPAAHPGLNQRKSELESRLREQYAGMDRRALRELPVLQAYERYYGQFKKTYHVQLQLESVVMKGRGLPNVAALVEAMFMAELDNLLLTAGHDLDTLQLPVRIAVAGENAAEDPAARYTLLRGTEESLKPGDMYMVDGQGIISSILSGPDQRTQITPSTRRALFAVYAPPGIPAEAVHKHLGDIESNARLISPDAETKLCQVFTA